MYFLAHNITDCNCTYSSFEAGRDEGKKNNKPEKQHRPVCFSISIAFSESAVVVLDHGLFGLGSDDTE